METIPRSRTIYLGRKSESRLGKKAEREGGGDGDEKRRKGRRMEK